MKLEIGDRVEVESESVDRPPRTGVVRDKLGSESSPRYLVRWDDGHESIYTPAAGALHRLSGAKRKQSTTTR